MQESCQNDFTLSCWKRLKLPSSVKITSLFFLFLFIYFIFNFFNTFLAWLITGGCYTGISMMVLLNQKLAHILFTTACTCMLKCLLLSGFVQNRKSRHPLLIMFIHSFSHCTLPPPPPPHSCPLLPDPSKNLWCMNNCYSLFTNAVLLSVQRLWPLLVT